MRPAHWMSLLRAATVASILVSAMLVVDYSNPLPSFCSIEAGCEKVRRSGLGFLPVIGISIPVVGVIGFAALLGASMWPSVTQRRRLTGLLGLMAAAGGIGFIIVQKFAIGAWCSYCLVVDFLAIACGVAGFFILKAEPEELEHEPIKPWAWALLGLLAFAAPLLWPRFMPRPAVPAEVAQYYAPGKINVIEFADYECPHCRLLHARLKPLLKEYPGRIHLVRLNVPLPMHRHARGAAAAAICAEAQGHGDEMADWLFSTEDLSQESILEHAPVLGIDMSKFKACMNSAKTAARIEKEANLLGDRLRGLPTTYIGDTELVGSRPEATLRDALDRAASGAGHEGVPAPLYWSLNALFALGIAALGWRRQR